MTETADATTSTIQGGYRWSDSDWRNEMETEVRRIEGQVQRLAEMMQVHMEQERAQQMQIDRLIEALNKARGGISALLWVGGALATVVAGIAWLWDHTR